MWAKPLHAGRKTVFDFPPLDRQTPIATPRAAAQLGLAVGISSGANFLGALQVQEDLGPDATVATIFCDSNKKYLSTDLLRDEPVRPGYLSPEIELLGVETAAATT